MNGFSKWHLAVVTTMLVALSMTVGCAQEVGDLDRTQPELLEKEQFLTDHEWYYQQTVVDTDMQGSMIFKTYQGPLKRIRWTVTENYLYAHSTVELADNLMDGFDDDDTRRLGVVAAFPIRGHFDVQRSYNAATGEPSNVIMENASDRPWYERQYMRVDWSRSMANGLWMLGGFFQMAPLGHTFPQESDRPHPNRVRISDDYIDTVTEYAANTDIMACYGAYGYDTIFNCEGGRVSVRNSFMRVPEEQTYLPLNYLDAQELTRDDTPYGERMLVADVYDSTLGYQVEVECTEEVRSWLMEQWGYDWEVRCRPAVFDFFGRFGYFRTDRVFWDRFVGTADDTRQYWVNRWNIWQTMVDEDGNELDMEDRIPKPITFYLNLEYPEFMFDAAQKTAHEWDLAFRGAVKVAQGITDEELDAILEEHYGHTHMYRIVENSCHPGPLVEWRNTFGEGMPEDRDSVHGIFQTYVGTIADDARLEAALWDLSNQARTQLCSELEWATETRDDLDARFTWERFGDLRYSFFNWVEESVPWAGYGPSAADPLTGELIQGNANFAGAYIRRIATYAADLVQYFNGELSDEDIMAGTQIRRDLFHNTDTASQRFGLTPEGRQEMSFRLGVDPAQASTTNFQERPSVDDLHPFILSHGRARIEEEVQRLAVAASKAQARDERMIEFLQHPDVKNFLIGNVEVQLAMEAIAHERFGLHYDDEQFNQVYLDFNSPRVAYHRTLERDRMLAERNIMTLDAMTRKAEMLVTYRGVADYFRGKTRTELIEYFMNGMFIGTQLHEIGHTVGLRHNFAATTDALNYHDEYWLIRQAVVEGRISEEEAHSIQGQLAREISGRDDVDYLSESEYRLASVMDYTGDFTARFAGLGKYDFAAINFAYGEAVEVWREDIPLPNLLSYDTWVRDYSELPLILASGSMSSEEPLVDRFAHGVDLIMNGREFMPISEAITARREGIESNTSKWLTYDFGPGNEPVIDRTVEYEFCADDLRGRTLGCDVWAFGANQTETVNHAFDTFRAFQPFWRYRRHNISRLYENYNSYINRLFNTFQQTQNAFRFFALYRWFDIGDFTDDLQRASMDAFNFYNEVIAMPETGRFCLYDPNLSAIDSNWFYDLSNTYVPARYHSDGGTCGDHFDIPRGHGALYNFGFTNEYAYRIDRVGSFIDKMIASQMIFDLNANFAQSAFFTDFRATSSSYYTVFNDEMLALLRGGILGDYQDYGGIVEHGEYLPPRPIDPGTFGRGIENPQNGAPRIFTPDSINVKFNMLVGGMIYSSGWEDRTVDFSHQVKVSTTTDESQPFADGVPILEFQHPVTYQVYQAADIGGTTVAGRMIEWANELADRYHEANDVLETLTPGTAEYNQVRAVRDHRLEQLQDVVARMDMVRFVFGALGASALR